MRLHRLVTITVVAVLTASACGRSGHAGTASSTASAGISSSACKATPLHATDVGITDSTITIETLADVGSPLAPGLFQGNIDAVNAFAAALNASGGIACRRLVVRTWDTKLSPAEAKNGLIDACANAFAMVGGDSLFNPDPSPMTGCTDGSGAATGLPDLAASANDINEQCAPTAFIIQNVAETCPITPGGGPRPQTAMVGPTRYYASQVHGLHGLFLIPGDLPTTVQSAMVQIQAQGRSGVSFDATPKVSGADTQAAYTSRVQTIRTKGGTFVYDGSNDTAMIRIRKEAKAQGVDSVKVWACSLACYTNNFISQGGTDVEGTYLWMQFLPFEEASANPEAQAYVSAVGAKATSFGAQAWQAAVLFRAVVNEIVGAHGPNGLTRATLLTALRATKDFTANGWIGKTDLKGFSPCFVILQVQGAKFVRVYPKQKGTFDCNAANLTTLTIDPTAEAAKIK